MRCLLVLTKPRFRECGKANTYSANIEFNVSAHGEHIRERRAPTENSNTLSSIPRWTTLRRYDLEENGEGRSCDSNIIWGGLWPNADDSRAKLYSVLVRPRVVKIVWYTVPLDEWERPPLCCEIWNCMVYISVGVSYPTITPHVLFFVWLNTRDCSSLPFRVIVLWTLAFCVWYVMPSVCLSFVLIICVFIFKQNKGPKANCSVVYF